MKTAVIIGATSGIGRAVAEQFLEDGWRVGVAGRRADALAEITSRYGSAVAEVLDITADDAAQRLDALLQACGAPDLFLHVSGVGLQNPQMDEEKELRVIRTNCDGMVRIVSHFINYVKSSGEYGPARKAHIGVVTSLAGTRGMGISAAYSASKKMQSTYVSALVQLSRMEKLPVTFSDIRPGFVDTAILNPEKHYPMMIPVQKAAGIIIKGLSRRRRFITFDWRFRWIGRIWRCIPAWLWERITFVKN